MQIEDPEQSSPFYVTESRISICTKAQLAKDYDYYKGLLQCSFNQCYENKSSARLTNFFSFLLILEARYKQYVDEEFRFD